MLSPYDNRSLRRELVLVIFLGFILLFSCFLTISPETKAETGIDYIQIRDAPNGLGDVVHERTYYVGDSDIFWAAAYNYSGYIDDVEVYWNSSNPNVGTVNRTGVHTTFKAVGEGVTQVYANYYNQSGGNGTVLWNYTGTLTVLFRGVEYIQIRDAPHNGGEIVNEHTYFIDETDTFYAAGYNISGNYLGDVPADWSSNTTEICMVNAEGVFAVFKAMKVGVCHIVAEYDGTIGNSTGNLTIKERDFITVDDSGGADYFTIHEAVENASAGSIIYVYNGTYNEHVVIDKNLFLIGESTSNTIVEGGNSGIVFLVKADGVSISKFTIPNASYGIYLDHCNATKIQHTKITHYTYGIYANRTRDAYIAHNVIMHGAYGIVTDHVKNDAVRYNEIAYNTVYGAKDYDSSLKNCFNWNYFHHNKVAYYYDPDEPLDTLTFDGNVLEDNDVGIKVAYASSLVATNNTLRRNGIGIELIETSPYFSRNILVNNNIGIKYRDSSALLYRNRIEGGDYGIIGSGISPAIERNEIIDSNIFPILITSASHLRLIDNEISGGVIRIIDSSARLLFLKGSRAQQLNSTVLEYSIDASSQIEVQWYLTIRVLNENGRPIENAIVRILNDAEVEIANAVTSEGGYTGPIILTQKVRSIGGDQLAGAYIVEVTHEGDTTRESILMDENKHLAIVIGPVIGPGGEIPWLFIIIIGFSGILVVGGLLSIEVVIYFLVALFIPLYTKLKKEDVLDHYSRGRVYQFIELNPGEHFSSIKKALDLNIGTATYHLEVLQRNGLIKSRQDGIYKRFYPAKMPLPPSNGGVISETQARVLEIIKESPGITQKELARFLGIRQSTLNYQVTKLEERGLIEIRRKGRRVHYYAKAEIPSFSQ